VATFDPINGRRLYVNGEYTGDADPVTPGLLSTWDDTFARVDRQQAHGARPGELVGGLAAEHQRKGRYSHQLRSRRGRKIPAAVQGGRPDRRAPGLRDVRGAAVRQPRLPVQ